MKKYILTLTMLLLSSFAYDVQAQSMTDQQLITFIMEERDKGTSQNEIITKLMQRGVDIQQIQRVKRRYDRQINSAGLGYMVEGAVGNAASRMRQNNGQGRKGSNSSTRMNSGKANYRSSYSTSDPDFIMYQQELGDMLPSDSLAMLREYLRQERESRYRIFGHDLFSNENLTFEPNMNIATPKDYVLGPGDAVIVDVYGASQESFSETISPDGFITIQGFGPIQ